MKPLKGRKTGHLLHMDDPERHYIKQNKTQKDKSMLCDLICMQKRKHQTHGGGS